MDVPGVSGSVFGSFQLATLVAIFVSRAGGCGLRVGFMGSGKIVARSREEKQDETSRERNGS